VACEYSALIETFVSTVRVRHPRLGEATMSTVDYDPATCGPIIEGPTAPPLVQGRADPPNFDPKRDTPVYASSSVVQP